MFLIFASINFFLYDFLVKVADFHTKNVIFKVEYLTEEQKRARIFNGFVQSDDKRSQKLQHCAYPLISGLKLFKTHHSALLTTINYYCKLLVKIITFKVLQAGSFFEVKTWTHKKLYYDV